MSWLQVGCPRCSAVVNVPASLAGQMIACAGCGLTYQVPSPIPAVLAPPPPLAYPPLVPPQPYGATIPSAYGAPLLPPAPPLEVAATPPGVDVAAPAATKAIPLKPVEVLAPPTPPTPTTETSRSESPQRAEASRVPVAADSPTLMLPPAAKPRSLAPLPLLSKDVPSPAPAVPPAKEQVPLGDADARAQGYPSVPTISSAPQASSPAEKSPRPGSRKLWESGEPASREELAAVEARMRRARRRAGWNLAMLVFGLATMIVFAIFVVRLSRPG